MATKMAGYKALLLKCQELRGQAGAAAYDRAKMLVQVFDSQAWRADASPKAGQLLDDLDAGRLLDAYVEDLALGFLDLRAMLEHFPEREQWAQGLLKRMHAEMLAARETTEEQPARKRSVVTKQELEAVENERDHLKARADYLTRDIAEVKDELKEARQQVKSLEAENRQLRESLARADGRISELERIAARELVAA